MDLGVFNFNVIELQCIEVLEKRHKPFTVFNIVFAQRVFSYV